MVSVPVASLLEDFTVYPRERREFDTSYFADVVRAMRAGVRLPPPIVEKKSMRIVDGFHRIEAHKRIHGLDSMIDVELKTYGSERELVEEAVRLNAAHGCRLTQGDRARCVVMLEQAGVPQERIAELLCTTEDRVIQLSIRVVSVGGEQRPVKPLIWARDDPPDRLTVKQYEVAKRASGWRPLQTVRQLTAEIRAGVLDLDNEDLAGALWELHAVIAEVVPLPSEVE